MKQELKAGFFPAGFFPELSELERDLARLEQSWCDFSYSLRTGHRIKRDKPGRLRFQAFPLVRVHQHLEQYRERVQRGESGALVGALSYACGEGVPLPYWLAQAIQEGITRTFETETTLHTAFGLAGLLPESGKKARNARQMLKARVRLWLAVHEAKREGAKGLNDALKQVLRSQPFPFGLTKARHMFNEQERIQRMHLGMSDRHR
jgi:hypothetical protein